MAIPNCYKDHFKNESTAPPTPIVPELYTIPRDTILYTGALSIPTKENNVRKPPHVGKSRYTYMTTICDSAIEFATSFGTQKGYLIKYRVKEPIQIYIQHAPFDTYFFQGAAAYASNEAQCLCQNDLHGYGSLTTKGLDDIGLCNKIYGDNYLEEVKQWEVLPSIRECKALTGGKRRRRTTRRRRHLRKSRS